MKQDVSNLLSRLVSDIPIEIKSVSDDLDDTFTMHKLGDSRYVEYACPDVPRRVYNLKDTNPHFQRIVKGIDRAIKRPNNFRGYQRH